MRRKTYYFIACLVLSVLAFGDVKKAQHSQQKPEEPPVPPVQNLNEIFRDKAGQAYSYCKRNGYDTQICVLIDMGIHSGLKRFVVWDFNKGKVGFSALVSHGCCDNDWGEDQSKDLPVFSNIQDSHCSSLGKYKIGERGYSSWGINVKYQLHGLENTNRAAMKRQIVFHGWNDVSDKPVYPAGTPEGYGCPAVSNNAMRAVDNMLRYKKKPVLMWIYN